MTKKAEAELGAPKKPVESNATGNSAKLFLEMAKNDDQPQPSLHRTPQH